MPGVKSGDPLGRVIALVLLAIFLLSIATLCVRIFAASCLSGGRKCCVVQCALQVKVVEMQLCYIKANVNSLWPFK